MNISVETRQREAVPEINANALAILWFPGVRAEVGDLFDHALIHYRTKREHMEISANLKPSSNALLCVIMLYITHTIQPY